MELFDIIEPRHPCAGTLTLSLEDVQLRVSQKMAELKLDERVKESREALSRTWVSSSSKVRGAMGSAWAGLDQYRNQRKASVEEKPKEMAKDKEGDEKENGKGGEEKGEGEKRETFVGGWSAWAAEKRKKAPSFFHREDPVKLEPRSDIGPAPARPLAQWAAAAAKRKSESGSSNTAADSGVVESVRSSSDAHTESMGKEME